MPDKPKTSNGDISREQLEEIKRQLKKGGSVDFLAEIEELIDGSDVPLEFKSRMKKRALTLSDGTAAKYFEDIPDSGQTVTIGMSGSGADIIYNGGTNDLYKVLELASQRVPEGSTIVFKAGEYFSNTDFKKAYNDKRLHSSKTIPVLSGLKLIGEGNVTFRFDYSQGMNAVRLENIRIARASSEYHKPTLYGGYISIVRCPNIFSCTAMGIRLEDCDNPNTSSGTRIGFRDEATVKNCAFANIYFSAIGYSKKLSIIDSRFQVGDLLSFAIDGIIGTVEIKNSIIRGHSGAVYIAGTIAGTLKIENSGIHSVNGPVINIGGRVTRVHAVNSFLANRRESTSPVIVGGIMRPIILENCLIYGGTFIGSIGSLLAESSFLDSREIGGHNELERFFIRSYINTNSTGDLHHEIALALFSNCQIKTNSITDPFSNSSLFGRGNRQCLLINNNILSGRNGGKIASEPIAQSKFNQLSLFKGNKFFNFETVNQAAPEYKDWCVDNTFHSSDEWANTPTKDTFKLTSTIMKYYNESKTLLGMNIDFSGREVVND